MEYNTRNKQQNIKKNQCKELLSRNLQKLVEKMEFDDGQLYNNAQETAKAKQIKLLGESIDALKISTLSA